MAIELATKYLPYTDEIFTTESKKSLLTNQDFSWEGAKTVKIYKISTAAMNDYSRLDFPGVSKYGTAADLNATTETFMLEKDRSFTFVVDALDNDETALQLQASTALARQQREVVIPEIDTYVYDVMCTNAGTIPTALALTAENIYDQILTASKVLDDAEVPETERCLVVTPDTYVLMKQSTDIIMETDIGNDLRLKGVIGMLDGADVIKIPAVRLPAAFGFMLAHKSATVAPTKLQSFKIHDNPPGINGSLVEGRIVYDAFVLENKAMAIYYQATA
ncbi:hypothetical protein Q5O24_09085 [Eubacteriaceae bacterium ES3]|nr:hypothetical protein Q5O24_09085 [Eubacteriaceae bacterium ES3]